MKASARAALLCFALTCVAHSALAQSIPGWDCVQFALERVDADRVRLTREVECNGTGPNAGHQIFADDLVGNIRTGEFEASGNVLLVSPTARLSAERVVYNTRTQLGTFHTASGFASLGDRGQKDRSMFGTLEPDLYFWGRTIEKIGPDKYRITDGSFTTCVQPTPRWDIGTGNATINLEDYAVLRNAVVRVKDVPVFYLPVIYYPIQSDDRATGFLLPSYGSSTFRGQSLSNAFFWAINRSQDLTLMHDWFTNTGQGTGTEYRYVLGPGSEGNLRAYWLNQKQTVIEDSNTVVPAERSYEVRGTLAQMLPAGFRARGHVDYFSSLVSQQLYNTDIYYASRRQRTFGGSVTGNWGGVTLTGNFLRAELFGPQTGEASSTINGYAPSITANLSSRRLGSLPVYASVASDFGKHLYIVRSGENERDFSVGRVDVQPNVRAALTSWPFLNVNASLGFRNTYFTQSLDDRGVQVPVGLTRRYFDMRADVIGPTFSRVFTPNNAFADRLKHVIEPTVSVQRVTNIENQDRFVQIGGSYDFVVGGVTRVSYGLNNRVLVRKASKDQAAPAASAPRELLTMSLTQSYYTDANARRFDSAYQTNQLAGTQPSHFSPVALLARTSPTALTSATVRMEFDQEDGALRTFQTSGSSTYRAAQVNIGWSRVNYKNQASQSALNASSTFNFAQGRTGGNYAVDWDISRGYIIQQRWVGFYNAQCCGLAVEYQQFKFPTSVVAGIPQDRRFNLSFTLAGIGSFSNFFGAFGGGRF
jgi:lipopolysaccharide assembly outer membrane protein LptD (OstA)